MVQMNRLSNAFRTICILLFISCCIPAAGDEFPLYNIPSPEIANLGLYDQVPVSLFTGTPNITIPIYDVEVGRTKIPIAANYHVGAVKPNSFPGPLNLGWSLMAGGYITRNVRGAYDEIKDNQGVAHGFYAHHSKLQNLTTQQFDSYMAHYTSDDNSWYELSADEFSFNFCGYTGNFYLNEDGNWTVVSDHDIKVEFSPSDGFISLNELNARLGYTGWNNHSRNQRYFKTFTLVTPDGARYEFGGINAMEFSIPYYARQNSDLIATTWRLTKITTPEKRVITLVYEVLPLTCDLQYIPMFSMFYGQIAWQPSPYKYGLTGFTGFLLFPVALKHIITPNESIDFNYEEDTTFGQRLMPNGRYALYWNTRGNIRGLSYSSAREDPVDQFQVFMRNVDIDRNYPNQSRTNIANALKHYILSNISINNSDTAFSKKIYFIYQSGGRRKLTNIIERKDVLVDSVSAYGMHQYYFKYNTTVSMPEKYLVAGTDSWGYYHGDNVTYSSPTTNYDIITPNLEATKAEVLTEITNPTGGKTLFDYELNNYSQMVDTSRTSIQTTSGYSGGLRIRKITNVNDKGNFVSAKRYYYSKNRSSNSPQNSSGISKGMPILTRYYIFDPNVYFIERSLRGYYAPVTNHNTPDVGYSWVIEEDVDSVDNGLGYIRYHFSNYDMDPSGDYHFDQLALYASNTNINSYAAPYTSYSFQRGKLLSKEYFDCNGSIVRKETNVYQQTNHFPFVTPHQETIYLGLDGYGDPYMANVGYITLTHTASYFLKDVIDSVYNTSNSNAEVALHGYNYNSHKMLLSETHNYGYAPTVTTTYHYSYDYPSYSWMYNNNYNDYIVDKIVSSGGMYRKETNNYSVSGVGVPYLQKKTISNKVSVSDNYHDKTVYEVLQADNYGNPLEILADGMHTALLWGHSGQRVVARVENASYQDLSLHMGLVGDFTLEDYINLYTARQLMPSAQFHIYKYNNKLLLTEEIGPNQHSVYYDYDALGRLKESYIMENNTKKILKKYGYKFYFN